jgi:hypothetical protein
MDAIERFEEFDRSARVVRVFTRTKRKGRPVSLTQYDKHVMNRKPRK